MVAARLLPVHRRRLPDGAAGFGANLAGTAFLQDIPAISVAFPNAKLIIEVAWGASISADPTTWSWTDISVDVLQDGNRKVDIAPMGRSTSSTQTQPAGCSYVVNNTSGAYSQGPQSSNYPNVKLNVPMRVSVNLTGYPNDSQVRFQGYIWSMKPSWDTTGNYAVVEVKASGIMRRLNTGTQPVRSALNRIILKAAPVAYWPLEDQVNSTQAASGLSQGTSLTASGTVQFAAITAVSGSKPLPEMLTVSGTPVGFLVGPVTMTATGSWTVQAVISSQIPQVALEWTIVEWHEGANVWSLARTSSSLYFFRNGVQDGIVVFSNSADLNGPRVVQVTATQNGTALDWTVTVDNVVKSNGSYASTTVDAVSSVRLFSIPSTLGDENIGGLGHVAVFSNVHGAASEVSALTGYLGESPVARLIRLCSEDNVHIDVVGTSITTMGSQSADTLMNLLRECEAADLGTLGDGRGPGLYYVSRSARYNQTVGLSLSATADHLMLPFEAEGDDLAVFNKFVVERKGGSTGEFQDENGSLGTRSIGTFESSASINVNTDSVLVDVAAWLVHVNTVLGYRYPTVTLDMRKIPSKVLDWLRMNPSSRLQVANVANWATQHPNETIDLLAEGWSESLSRFFWDVQTNCSPESPYEVGVLNSLLRIETGGSTIATEADASATSLSVASSGVVWVDKITFPADFNFDIEAGTGERMTVTDIVGTSSPQTFTVTRSVNGIAKTLPVGTTIKLWRPTALAL